MDDFPKEYTSNSLYVAVAPNDEIVMIRADVQTMYYLDKYGIIKEYCDFVPTYTVTESDIYDIFEGTR